MATLKKYVTQIGDRWDSIAGRAYGQPEKWPEIVRANPNMAMTALLPVGVAIWVPVEDSPATTSTTVGLPPWKR